VGWKRPGCCPQMVCQVNNVVTFPFGPRGQQRWVCPAVPARFRGSPPTQPLLLSNGGRRKSRIRGKAIYKGYNLRARLCGLSRTGFFI
jgi:hypothetical protein